MICGISTYTYGWGFGAAGNDLPRPMDEYDLIEEATRFGVRCIQVGDNLPLHTFSPERLSAFGEAAKYKGLRLEIGARGLTDQNLERYVDLATMLDAPLLRFVIDDENYAPSVEYVIELLQHFEPLLTQRRVTLGIENHDRFRCSELRHIMKSCQSTHIGICLDTANSLGAGEGLSTVVDALAAYTVNLHIKDFAIERFPYKMGFSVAGAIAGQGMTNIPWLIEKVAHYNRCASAILEQWVVPEDSVALTIEKEQLWADQSVAYLKTLLPV